jgi:hypothetical protein
MRQIANGPVSLPGDPWRRSTASDANSHSLERIEGIAEVIAVPGTVRLMTTSVDESLPCLVKLSPAEAQTLARDLVEAADEADR